MPLLQFRRLSAMIFSMLFVAWTSLASAQKKCESLFPTTQIKSPVSENLLKSGYSAYGKELDPVLLAKNKFAVSQDGHFLLDLTQPPGSQVLGQLLIMKVKYLYQWASRPEHKEMVADGGITADYMDIVLDAPGQAAGKGFYVSTNPFDSATYGPELTTFQPKGSVVVVEYDETTLPPDPSTHRFVQETQLVQRLRAAGVDAVRKIRYQPTWLAMISTKHLQQAQGLPKETFTAISNVTDVNSVIANPAFRFSPVLPKAWFKKMPEENLLRRIVLIEPLKFQEVVDLLGVATDVPVFGVQGPMVSIATENAARRATDYLTQAKSPEEIVEVLKAIKGLEFSDASKRNFLFAPSMNHLLKPLGKRALMYKSILDSHELIELAKIAELPTAKKATKLDKLKETASKFMTSRPPKHAIYNTVADFLNDGRNAFGFAPEFRGKPFMSASSSNTNKAVQPDMTATFDSILKHFYRLLSPALQNELNAIVRKQASINLNDPEAQKVYKKTMEELTAVLLNPTMAATYGVDMFPLNKAADFYRLFLLIRPFETDNEKMGRLYYSYVSAAVFSFMIPPIVLGVGVHDKSKFANSSEFEKAEIVGLSLKHWIQQASNDQDFLLRARWGVEILFRVFPEQRVLHPELTAITQSL